MWSLHMYRITYYGLAKQPCTGRRVSVATCFYSCLSVFSMLCDVFGYVWISYKGYKVLGPVWLVLQVCISASIQQVAGHTNGGSCRSVRRFCRARGATLYNSLSNVHLHHLVGLYVQWIGHEYSQRSVHGLLWSHGIQVSQQRLAAALRRVAPFQYRSCSLDTYTKHWIQSLLCNTLQWQNFILTKMRDYICLVSPIFLLWMARAGIGFVTVPVKRAIPLCNLLLQPLLLKEDLWEQVRVDHGTEVALVDSVQHSLVPFVRVQHNTATLFLSSLCHFQP